MKGLKNLKVAIVHDWLTGIGGAELVVLELHRLFPEAPIYTSQYDPYKLDWFRAADVRTTWLQRLPKGLKKFLPLLRAFSFSRLDLSAYDLVISSSGAEAKYVKTGPNTFHVAYIHAPTHYYWSRYEAYLRQPGFGRLDWLARLGLKTLVGPLRKWDYKAAQRPQRLIANSSHTQSEIRKYYGRDSTVIFPPVDTSSFAKYSKPAGERQDFVITGRQTPYKRIDLAVDACTKLSLRLVVIGDGPQHNKLLKSAGPTIEFTGQLKDHQAVAEAVGSAQAFIFPGIDDFGIAPVEALAAGTPVIAYQDGGALDYVNNTTGRFFEKQTVDSLARTLQDFDVDKYSSEDIKKYAARFSRDKFREAVSLEIQKVLQ